jgi:hypothetical protein
MFNFSPMHVILARQKGKEENDNDALTLDREECALFAVFAQNWRNKRSATTV